MPIRTYCDEQPTLNLTPMIDIVFLLVIFFMVGTKFAEMERNITLDVPGVRDASRLAATPESRVINVHRDGTITLDQEQLTLDQLAARLRQPGHSEQLRPVVVRGDAAGPLQHVASVLGVCQQSGIPGVGIAVRWDREQAP
jgi:biopolymer transport protein ExbD